MRQRAEELAAEEREYQNDSHDRWLEMQIARAINRFDAGERGFVSDEQVDAYMANLKALAAKGEL